ncbi:methionine sulfoxide reductase catalytic subunit [Bathymodiolus thermophilus thioautotrophic gill symbiont]|uniref:Protein-methionine-sulfoxide reductase catalytic subunit MsrP n=1 Tax=Bathymodiolus thermophilus thioautotrophic gill symbiont TaxID=2360 RepID=A0A3G3IKC0_9GAMM|nr:protein-methionine-sulfoxide reductase catalytic subunit MsrP [Bathymodiolus thermophilus thioautotrophic gill symbiont]AYQ56275.1 methionine sulfoxide reductase catalytic subunit [Bathymodiolus thermophilus thioautotrophic gill symbiont]CAB5506568.1 Protein-methionine-sulfoxide reductase catalytic subunit MsrP [Bathymodiolus thermophilus thioautotrophic gill symbiont]
MKKIPEYCVTNEADYLNRRTFIKKSVGLGVGLAAFGSLPSLAEGVQGGGLFDKIVATDYGKGLVPHTYKEISNYNNFYEFGTGKRDPAKNAHTLKPAPWHIEVSGECVKRGVYDLEDFIAPYQLQERIYRFRCVEAWSMVIPWVGVSLASVLKTFQPTSKAKYVVFKTLLDKTQMPWQKRPTLDWPYTEGLTIAEAMNPLSFLAVGLYGKTLPNQNGAPLRLVVPWKYGFKNIKSIVSIHFQETAPINTWQDQAASEYGFYANVNPNVDHPRWSQARERVIGRGSFFSPEKRKTEMFNGYGDEVAHLYTGLDLTKNF